MNLKNEHPELVTDLEQEVKSWRARIENRWTQEFSPEAQGTVTHSSK
jgi:hypothetical protein